MENLYGDQLKRINQINRWYEIYEGNQKWSNKKSLQYEPTKKTENYIQKIISTRARFMFGVNPFFDVRPINFSEHEEEIAQEKEDLLKDILDENKFHKKLMQGYKDSHIAGNVGIKLWARKDEGLKIFFVPAQEYFIEYDTDDIDSFNAVTFFHFYNTDAENQKDQRGRKQRYYLENDKCYVDEYIVDGYGDIIEIITEGEYNGLDFIPFINITNGGLTGDVFGSSSVETLWEIQDIYNKVSSDDIDALKFQMFGQTVFMNADENTLKNLVIAPGAIIDYQTDKTSEDTSGDVFRLESSFSYSDQLEKTLARLKGSMYDLLEVPNVSTEQLKGLMASGKSMEAIYWNLIAACDEDWSEWGPNLKQMAEMIFEIVATYNLYGKGDIAKQETSLEIEKYYPLSTDENEEKRIDLEEVKSETRSRRSYMDKWSKFEDVDNELDRIVEEKQILEQDTFLAKERDMFEGIGLEDEDEIEIEI